MKNQLEKAPTSKQKQFSVIVEKVEVLNTSEIKEADAKIKVLQTEFKPLIILIDKKEKTSVHYSKTSHQRNYRIEAGNFEKDIIKPTPDEEVTQE
ncbi:hypothetical protein [Flavobacterium panacagri]|uniref:hypothetical protein n=1 Tax=Flavobacterium panacagri TaxID=3034146 RepID=UPI0025A60901|nr:hypothetical protein [Flavobacterium panacagri]